MSELLKVIESFDSNPEGVIIASLFLLGYILCAGYLLFNWLSPLLKERGAEQGDKNTSKDNSAH